jgi:hypothetical protein
MRAPSNSLIITDLGGGAELFFFVTWVTGFVCVFLFFIVIWFKSYCCSVASLHTHQHDKPGKRIPVFLNKLDIL